jgi:hypothetical protein
MDGMDKNGLLNGQWTMDNGQEWTRTAGDIFLYCYLQTSCFFRKIFLESNLQVIDTQLF